MPAPARVKIGAMDPTPFEDAPAFWAMTAQLATILMAVIMFGVFLFLARPLLVPLLAALIVAFTIGPLTGYAVKHGLPAWVPAVVIVTIIGAMFYFAVLLLADPISDLIARSGEIGANIKDKFRFMERPLTALKELYSTFAGSSGVTVDVSQPTEVIGSVVGTITPAMVQFMLFFATLFFFVLGRAAMRQYIVNIFATRDGRLRSLKIFNDTERSLNGYLLTVTIINAGVGLVCTLVTWSLGFPAPLLWGALAFVLNYIPYVGPGVMHMVLFVIGLLTFDTLAAGADCTGFVHVLHLHRRAFPGADHHRTPVASAPTRGVPVAGVLGVAVGTGRRVAGDADPDHGEGRDRPSLSTPQDRAAGIARYPTKFIGAVRVVQRASDDRANGTRRSARPKSTRCSAARC